MPGYAIGRLRNLLFSRSKKIDSETPGRQESTNDEINLTLLAAGGPSPLTRAPRIEPLVSATWEDLRILRNKRIAAWEAGRFYTQSAAYNALMQKTITKTEIESLFARRNLSQYLAGPKSSGKAGLLQSLVESEQRKVRQVFIKAPVW